MHDSPSWSMDWRIYWLLILRSFQFRGWDYGSLDQVPVFPADHCCVFPYLLSLLSQDVCISGFKWTCEVFASSSKRDLLGGLLLAYEPSVLWICLEVCFWHMNHLYCASEGFLVLLLMFRLPVCINYTFAVTFFQPINPTVHCFLFCKWNLTVLGVYFC
jgi:hypothetical protein